MRRSAMFAGAVVLVISGCGDAAVDGRTAENDLVASSAATVPPDTTTVTTSTGTSAVTPVPTPSPPDAPSITAPLVTAPLVTAPLVTAPLVTAPLVTAPPAADSSGAATAPLPDVTVAAGEPRYVIPVAAADQAGWGETHAGYPAIDIFQNGCGGDVVSPVDGTVLEVRRVNEYDPDVDDPATRGGRSVAMLGVDGVRYYLAHLELVADDLAVGMPILAGGYVGTIGTTGRSSACHVHFGISPPCTEAEWSVRRGVVWPYPYLDAWRNGEQISPVSEIEQWLADNPTGCADAARG